MSDTVGLGLTPRLLLGPGPSEVHPRVLSVMSTPLLGHLDPQFLDLMGKAQDMLRRVFQTSNPLTFAVSGTGMAGMETCLVNLLEPGDRLLVCVNGVFGQRMVDVGRRAGAEVSVLERPFGEVFDPEQVRDALRRFRPKAMGIVHAETSTGAWQPHVGELGKLCREAETLLILDTVTSLAGVPVEIDAWGVDAVYSGTQKCLSAPPGLSPVSFGPRAVEAMNRRTSKVQSWYLDATMIQRYLGQERFYHHTAPITMIYALYEALRVVLEEGLPARFERHLRNHRALKAGLEAMNLGLATPEGHRLPQLNAVSLPPGTDDVAGRKRLLNEFGIEVGGGLGDFKGHVWRVGLMGHGSRRESVLRVLAAMEACFGRAGGVAAAERFYAGG